jgi:hypothetical protein
MKYDEGEVKIIYFYFYEIYSFLNSEEVKNIVRYKEKKKRSELVVIRNTPKKKSHINIVTDWAVSRRRIHKHVPTNELPAIEGRPVLGNRPVNTHHSNECAAIGLSMLGNAWVDGCTGTRTRDDIHT